MLISIFDERIRGSYSQGYEPFFKLVNFYENSHEFYNEFSKRNNEKSNVKSTFCSIPCLKEVGIKNESKVVAGCKVLDIDGNDKEVYIKASDLGIKDFDSTKKYNVPIYIENARRPYITYPTYDFKEDENAPVLKSSFINDINNTAIKNEETEIYKLNKHLGGITILEARRNIIRRAHPIYLKYYYLNIYTYSDLDFFFFSYAPKELEDIKFTNSTTNKWYIVKLQYDDSKIQQIIELHGYVFIFLKDKTVVYSLAYADEGGIKMDISESSGQNLPIGTNNTFSVIKYINKIITVYNNGVYTISQFQPSKISFPAVDEWITENKEQVSLMIVKEQSYEFLYVVNNKEEAWILNFHNNKWSFTNNAGAYKQIRYNDDRGKYIGKNGEVLEYSNTVKNQDYIIETGLITLENNYSLFSVTELILSFNSVPKEGCQLLIEYKNNKNDKWINLGGKQEIKLRHFKGGKVLHKRVKIRASQFLLKITFTPAQNTIKSIIINDINFNIQN
jgi:hypothetical protein